MHGSTVFLIAFFTAIATAAGTVYTIERFDVFHKQAPAPAPEAIVPDLHGFTEADARANAQASHITLMVASREAAADVKPGSVVRQSIPAGQHVPQNHPVSVVLADELPKIPSVTGMSVVDATKRLEEKGFKLQAAPPVANATVPEGQIVSQNPAADSPSEKGKVVSVQVSAGAAEVAVPKVMGLSINNAKTALEKVGLVAEVRWVSLAETPTFIVLNQKPKPSEKLKPGSKVEITANQ
jgi:beta-lactam-binding protein with PASTA domain